MGSRSDQLAELIRSADRAHSIGRPVAVGFSNGANIAWSTLLRHPEALSAAVLMRPLMPFDPRPFSSVARRDPGADPGWTAGHERDPQPSHRGGRGAPARPAPRSPFEWVDAAHVQTDEDVEIAAGWLAAHADRLSATRATCARSHRSLPSPIYRVGTTQPPTEGNPIMRRRSQPPSSPFRWMAVISLLVAVATACGDDGETSGGGAGPAEGGSTAEEPGDPGDGRAPTAEDRLPGAVLVVPPHAGRRRGRSLRGPRLRRVTGDDAGSDHSRGARVR